MKSNFSEITSGIPQRTSRDADITQEGGITPRRVISRRGVMVAAVIALAAGLIAVLALVGVKLYLDTAVNIEKVSW